MSFFAKQKRGKTMKAGVEESLLGRKGGLLEYEFVRLHYKFNFWERRYYLEGGYLYIIEQYVNEGWDLLQIFQSNSRIYSRPDYLEIIFSRPLVEGDSRKRRVRYGNV